jgi:hypothetical protein
MNEYYLSEKTVGGYNGKVYGNYFVLDIDDSDVDGLTIRMKRFFEYMKDKTYYVFFSGNKGYHIYIPKEYVEYPVELESKWNVACHLFAQNMKILFPEFKDNIDLAVYDKVRLFRLPFSIHPKSGRKKQLVKWMKLDEENPTQSFISPIFRQEDVLEAILIGKAYPHITQKIASIKAGDIPKHKEINMQSGSIKTYVEYPYGEKLCIYKMLNTYDLSGMRHKAALRLQSYWKEKGYSIEFVWSMLKVWSERLTNPLAEDELRNIIKFFERGYVFTCNDDIKKHFCIPSCHMFKSKDVATEHIFMGNDYLNRYIEDMTSSQDNYIFMNKAYPEWGLPAIKPGHVVVLAGGPGSGKTTFMLNLMNKLRNIDWLFLSIEMSGVDIAEKYIKVTETDWHNELSKTSFKNQMDHIITIDKPNMMVTEIKDYVNMMRSKTGRMPNAIVIDYLSLLVAKGGNATERASFIARELKKIAKELRVAVFVLSQVPKDMAGDGNIPLGLDAPKDSGEVVNMADMLWTCWRPNRNRGKEEDDNVFRIHVPKNRHGTAGYIVDLDFVGSKYQINSTVDKETI